jgi:hypothetical protein
MWLITSLIAAIISTTLWYFLKKRYQLGILSLMLWGGTIMILVDHVLGYEGGAFIEFETEGLISNATLLGIAMLAPVLIVWLTKLSLSKLRK